MAWLVAILAAAGSGHAQEPADLFRFSGGPLSQDLLHGGEAVVEARPIEIDGSQLAAGQEKVRFELFRGIRYEAVLSGLERRGPAEVTWRGWLGRPGEDRVVLTFHESHVAGLVFSPEGVYEIAPLPDGGHRLARIDQDRFPACGGAPTPVRSGTETPLDNDVLAAAADSADQIDVMIAYTPQARNAAGGTAAIRTTAQNAVDMANTAFIDSGMVARFVLVSTVLANRNDSGDMVADLYWLTDDAGIAAARDVARADLVSLLVESGQGCGVGWVMDDPGLWFASHAFQVTARGCAVGNLSYAHEHGHNMGMEHNPENGSPPNQASYPWSFGHYVNGVFRTVMSYANPCANGCNRVARFSNPNLTYAGYATGIANQRDNHRTGDLTAPIVANFRQRTLGDFYTLTPCRLLDTRQQGPALALGIPRTITTLGQCGIPSTAAALAVNVTVTGATSSGYLALQPGNPAPSATSAISFGAGQTRGNNGVLALAADGAGTATIQAILQSSGTVHVILDVSGYFD
ncbi:MAG TPA: M12 family metallo-peptidase [Thermoanaerobaculia bacterium]